MPSSLAAQTPAGLFTYRRGLADLRTDRSRRRTERPPTCRDRVRRTRSCAAQLSSRRISDKALAAADHQRCERTTQTHAGRIRTCIQILARFNSVSIVFNRHTHITGVSASIEGAADRRNSGYSLRSAPTDRRLCPGTVSPGVVTASRRTWVFRRVAGLRCHGASRESQRTGFVAQILLHRFCCTGDRSHRANVGARWGRLDGGWSPRHPSSKDKIARTR